MWIGVAIVFLLAGAIVLALIRRRLIQGDDAPADEGLSLHSLRTLRDAGQLSEEEFLRARAALLGQAAPESGDEVEVRQARAGFDLAGDPLPPSDPEATGPHVDEEDGDPSAH